MKSRLQTIAEIPSIRSLKHAQTLLDELKARGLYVARRDELAEWAVNVIDRGIDLNDFDQQQMAREIMTANHIELAKTSDDLADLR